MVVYLRWCKDTAFFHRFQIFLKLFCCEIGCTNALFHRNMLFNIKNRVLTLLFAISIVHRTTRLEFIWKMKLPLSILIVGAAPIRQLDTDVTLGRDPHQPWAARKRKMGLNTSWRNYSAQMRSVAINAIGWIKKNNEPQQTFFSLNEHSIKKKCIFAREWRPIISHPSAHIGSDLPCDGPWRSCARKLVVKKANYCWRRI